jgi:arylformamidase
MRESLSPHGRGAERPLATSRHIPALLRRLGEAWSYAGGAAMRGDAMIGILSAALLAAATPAIVAQQGPRALVAGPVLKQALVYGPEQRQYLELFTKARAGRAPLIVYLHGGGWSAGSPKAGSGGAQAEFYTARGFAYAGIGYRYVPGVSVEQQLGDVARAIAFLRKRPEIDGRRIVLVGHSSGAHMAALLGSDPAHLEAAGVPFAAVRGVVLLDPAALDVPPLMAARGNPTIERYFRPAFGDDPARWSALSPMKQAAAPNAPAWLILHDANNLLAGQQGAELAAGLIAAGAGARVEAVAGTTHVRLNDEIGQAGDRASDAIAAFLAEAMPDTRRSRFR